MTGVTVNTPRVVAPGETLAFTNQIGLFLAPTGSFDGAPQTVLTVQGTVSFEATARVGNPVTGGYQHTAVLVGSSTGANMRVHVDAGGAIRVNSSVTASDSPAVAVWSSTGQPYILLNAGVIEVTSQGPAQAIHHAAGGFAPLTLGNTGLIRSTSVAGSAVGVEIGATSLNSTGRIEALGATEAIGVRIEAEGSHLLNRGLIVAETSGSAESIGVLWSRSGSSGFAAPFENAGRIEGDISLKAVSDSRVVQIYRNYGDMIGRVELGGDFDEFKNAGRIQGAVNLGSGNDTYDGAEGSASGMVAGGEGSDSLTGGAGFDNFQGNTGNDTERGGAGDDWVVGGKDHDALFGDTGSDLVYGNIGNDTCDGGDGADTIRGGQNDDILTGGAGNDWLSGDRGDDTVTGGTGADIFHSFGDAGLDRVTDFNAVEGDRVLLDPGTQHTVAQVGADTVITMAGGGQMILVGVSQASLAGGWIVVG